MQSGGSRGGERLENSRAIWEVTEGRTWQLARYAGAGVGRCPVFWLLQLRRQWNHN